MDTIDLAYVGRGIHEELIATIADQEGYFADEGLHVALRDGTGWDAERLRSSATIGLGRAVVERLTQGPAWQVLSVNTHRPLFWFLGNASVATMADLRGRRLAVHGAHTPPGCFARIVLRQYGLDPDHDVICLPRHPGDYQMDVRRLRDGSIDAAYVGSTLGPEQVAAEEGFHVLAWVGDHFQIPTVGIAVDPTHHAVDSAVAQALVRANQRALHLLAATPDRAVAYLQSFLNRLTQPEAQQLFDHYIGPHYTQSGEVDHSLVQEAVDAVAAELQVPSVSADEIYQFSS
ncbi:nitrate ABC transporter substrate-binding protein [Mycobacterium sp. 852013-50091_SCH5140682]|uniref:ABC transporter substrate-binding protein n=1 Tax=Mycobacterium sp. 852013-50091_SCH5140682 TaxID=1834109 RepID=UPI0007E9ED9C|nr:ABC transporter substrate-binding protein [Mycobacterium sp. 852013-50091_SCH5140682]OBC00133.1 nitrate ABC transporter substrate-binding protein [Mycobacterium sp. 852013-50091_SCH5140682]